MIKAHFIPESTEPLHILCLGAHCDDIEIGCGGTILSIIKNNPDVKISWIVFSSIASRKEEAILGANLFTDGAKNVDVRVLDFEDGFLPYAGKAVKIAFEKVKQDNPNPDIIFTHYRQDMHQDHRKVCELTWNTWRNHTILEYEIPKWDGDMGIPNSFVHLDQDIARKKITLLQQVYNSQQEKAWFTDDLFWSLMRIRGMESNSPSTVAEAFHTRKTVLNIGKNPTNN